MPLIIDGYNLLNVAGVMGRGRGPGTLQRARQALLNTLAESLPTEVVPKTTIVFDGSEAPWGVARQQKHLGLTVMFASRDEDADTVIESLIAADSAPKRLTIVSSDHRLQRAAKRRRATAVDSDKWFAQLLRERAQRSSPSATADVIKPQGPLTEGEVSHWMRQFGFDGEQS